MKDEIEKVREALKGTTLPWTVAGDFPDCDIRTEVGFRNASNVAIIVNAAPALLERIAELEGENERMRNYLIDTGEGRTKNLSGSRSLSVSPSAQPRWHGGEMCGMGCGTLILDGDERRTVTFEDDSVEPCCATCYGRLKEHEADVYAALRGEGSGHK
jgi:hypothetical protein